MRYLALALALSFAAPQANALNIIKKSIVRPKARRAKAHKNPTAKARKAKRVSRNRAA